MDWKMPFDAPNLEFIRSVCDGREKEESVYEQTPLFIRDSASCILLRSRAQAGSYYAES